MLLHHMKSFHGSSVLVYSVLASWGKAGSDNFFAHSYTWSLQLGRALLQLVPVVPTKTHTQLMALSPKDYYLNPQ